MILVLFCFSCNLHEFGIHQKSPLFYLIYRNKSIPILRVKLLPEMSKCVWAVVIMIIWKLDLQLPVQSVSIRDVNEYSSIQVSLGRSEYQVQFSYSNTRLTFLSLDIFPFIFLFEYDLI